MWTHRNAKCAGVHAGVYVVLRLVLHLIKHAIFKLTWIISPYHHLICLASMYNPVISIFLACPLFIHPIQSWLYILWEVPHLVVHAHQQLDNVSFVLFLWRLFADPFLTTHGDCLPILVTTTAMTLLATAAIIFLNSFQLSLLLKDSCFLFDCNYILLAWVIVIVEVESVDGCISLVVDRIYLSFEFIIGVEVLVHGVFSHIHHLFYRLKVLAVVDHFFYFGNVFKHVIHISLMLI